jgi:hypothetical protein
MNWLRVLGTAELSHIDHGVRQQFHGKMSLLQVFKTKEQPLELVLPRKGPIHTGSQGMDGFVEQTLSSSLRVLSITRILCNVRCSGLQWKDARLAIEHPSWPTIR